MVVGIETMEWVDVVDMEGIAETIEGHQVTDSDKAAAKAQNLPRKDEIRSCYHKQALCMSNNMMLGYRWNICSLC